MELIKEFVVALQERSTGKKLDFIRKMGCNEEVFSTGISNFTPQLKGKEVYLYSYKKETVIMLVDDYAPTYELADEEVFNKDELPLYFNDNSHRVSPVYQLREARHAYLECFRNRKHKEPYVLCVLVTASSFINKEDMYKTWDDKNVIVCDGIVDARLHFPTNGNTLMKEARYLCNYLTDLVQGKLTFTVDENDTIPTSYWLKKNLVLRPRNVEKKPQDRNEHPQIAALPTEDEKIVSQESERKNTIFDYIAPDDPDFYDVSIPSLDGMENVSTAKNRAKLPPVLLLERIDNPMEQLQSLVGLKEIKEHLQDLIAMTHYNRLLEKANPGGKLHKLNLHSIFTGPVGVGKTTVGRLYASLLYEAGMLSSGHVILASRSSFVGNLWGDEEKNLRKSIKLARGGVLFIDEAYNLASASKNDPGRLVLPQLLELLADEEYRDIAVILAGYTKPMEGLIMTNPGLESRFINRFTFDAFTEEQLMEVTQAKLSHYGYQFTKESEAVYRNVLHEAYENRNTETFGNGRYVANLLEKIYIRHARRCVASDIQSQSLLTLLPEDIPHYMIPSIHKMGFHT